MGIFKYNLNLLLYEHIICKDKYLPIIIYLLRILASQFKGQDCTRLLSNAGIPQGYYESH